MIAAAHDAGASVIPYIIGALAVVFPGGIVAFLKFRPERDSLVITATQGATTILNGVIEALEAQHERDQAEIERLETLIEAQAKELATRKRRARDD